MPLKPHAARRAFILGLLALASGCVCGEAEVSYGLVLRLSAAGTVFPDGGYRLDFSSSVTQDFSLEFQYSGGVLGCADGSLPPCGVESEGGSWILAARTGSADDSGLDVEIVIARLAIGPADLNVAAYLGETLVGEGMFVPEYMHLDSGCSDGYQALEEMTLTLDTALVSEP